jgi:hypothetical protein
LRRAVRQRIVNSPTLKKYSKKGMPGMNGTRLSGPALAFAVVYFLKGVAVVGQILVGFWSSFDRSLRNWLGATGHVKRWNKKERHGESMDCQWLAMG